MKFAANPGKRVEINVNGTTYLRHAVQTRFVTTRDSYVELVREYVLPIYQPGDILSISEKIVSICQNRIVRREELKIGFWAKFLSRFACRRNRGGYGVGMPINMQYAIQKVGLFRVLWASIAGGVCKLFGRKGVFYEIAGREVSGLDGFYDGAWEEYRDIGIEIPADPNGVCDTIRTRLGVTCMVVDANDFGQVILGKSGDIAWDNDVLCAMIRDNPAGQDKQRPPFILIRKA